jgi:hypothetical protein
MTETYVMENGSTIHWNGVGVYVAIAHERTNDISQVARWRKTESKCFGN